ncbi:MAG: Farnesyl diphosphate synthase [Syntrophomonadaceae bacterium]|nr:Farnesyl diphosphate synthase [Bacillota bacterium]
MRVEIRALIAEVDRALERYLPAEEAYPEEIYRAMRYSVFAGGKRLRPLLTLAAADIYSIPRQHALPVACALELVHTYSLVHDDLPALDNDDYRRGRLSNHRVFGEAIAILTGDALLTLAFELLARETAHLFPAATVVRLVQEMAAAAGAAGMIGGQVVDLLAEGRKVDAGTLDYIHRHKTGMLFSCAVRSGALLGEPSPGDLAQLNSFAEHAGLAFQIADDILDIVGDLEVLGKKPGSDLRKQKVTYPAMFGLAEAKRKATETLNSAKAALAPFGDKAGQLLVLADFLVNREC